MVGSSVELVNFPCLSPSRRSCVLCVISVSFRRLPYIFSSVCFSVGSSLHIFLPPRWKSVRSLGAFCLFTRSPSLSNRRPPYQVPGTVVLVQQCSTDPPRTYVPGMYKYMLRPIKKRSGHRGAKNLTSSSKLFCSSLYGAFSFSFLCMYVFHPYFNFW